MRRGGWQKRAGEKDGWGGWGGYKVAKAQKLEEQFCSDASKQQQKDGTSSALFNGVAIYVNGYTDPSADELRRLMMLHGGQYHMYYSRSKTTHIIATNLPNAKIKELKEEKVIHPLWIVESIKAGHLLSHVPYQLYTKQSGAQRGLNFNNVCKPEDPLPGPSNIAKEFNRINHTIKQHETENAIKINGIGSCNKEEEMETDGNFEFRGVEHFIPGKKQNRFKPHKDSTAIFNGLCYSSNGALKTPDHMVHSDNRAASKLSLGFAHRQEEKNTEKGSIDFRDCTMQKLLESNTNADILCSPHRTMNNPSSLHSNIKINGAHHYPVQRPSSTKSTSLPSPSIAVSSTLPKAADPSFISDFYSHSRLHHISMWKCEFTEFVRNLQRQSNGVFPGREKLKKLKTGNVSALSLPRCQNCIIHVDMDCFFVSVGIRTRPDLKGKPVAVTSNRGAGKTSLRPGADPHLEQQYYQNKILKNQAGDFDKLDNANWENIDSTKTNGMDLDISALSLAEIASCNYEARKAGIKNGMSFGQAKQLCPNLQAIPYDFHAYKEVAVAMYETLASYTCDIEAVSCDEALVDMTEILAETRLTPDEVANAIRTEIKEKTKCTASVGMGSNILLARMATRHAKPDGQYHLKPEEVDDFIRGQLVINLPGVGRSMDSKLASLGIKTCGDLQNVTMSKLQKEFGLKTGQMLYRFCRGLDDRPVRKEKERKSVSAEINYGIRFTQPKEAEMFLLNLSEEIQRRLEVAGMKGKRLTLKIMVRKSGAPIEPAKFGGHGICDNIARTVTLDHATDSAKVIGKEILNMFHTMKLNISDMRGVGIQMHQLVPVQKPSSITSTTAVQSALSHGGSHSVIDLFQVQKSKKCPDEEHKEASGICSFIPSLSMHLKSNPSPATSKTETAVKCNGLHMPINVKSKLNVSIEVPPPSQLDQSVLEALPPDIREQVEQTYSMQQETMHIATKKEPLNGCNAGNLPQPVAAVLLQIPELQDTSGGAGINVIALPAFSQVDPDVFAALPTELQEELRAAYDQRHRLTDNITNLQPANIFVSKNPLLQLKQAAVKTKKKNRKKNQTSPVKKIQSPLKNKLFGSPAKSILVSAESPQKLIDDVLKQEAATTDKSRVEPGPSTSNVSASPTSTKVSGCLKPQAPNLAGAIEFNDVKILLKEWITTISDPMEEDILQVVKYCTDLIDEKDLEKLDLVIKYMKRLMQQSVESVWNMAFDFILDNVQVVLQQTYGSTLKVT
ncbi:LOW QUALITY PROTEIN: DNA repair protein REV1 [Rhinatrema bivittatum]|uniref:LOW QUALITY PROTEIN: DNA repair protein REV1 n=1 Tax=Rhinatrema bivittatum TaxID=194408 RepID=UPI0011282439|nr:LOW QUALITY PROTEIN: DNA repair protein REV1 [Rhinatrema bivittatum]